MNLIGQLKPARFWLPRPLHPMAWWAWAIAGAAAISTNLNPLLIALLIGAVTVVVFSRRGDNPWAKSFQAYVYLGLFVVVIRVGYRVLFGGGDGPTILFRLPEIGLPDWVGGIRLLGPVSAEALLTGAYDGMRLAGIIICLGAANCLANPKRLLAALPGAFYEVGTVLVLAVAIFPQLGASAARVMKARKLRPRRETESRFRSYRVVRTIIIPVLSDALDSCLNLAASMDARGYGRSGQATKQQRQVTTAIVLVALVFMALGMYGLLSSSIHDAAWLSLLMGWPALVLGVALAILAMWLAGRGVKRTTYRPDVWQWAEYLTVGAGLASWLVLRLMTASGQADLLHPSVNPLQWPQLSLDMFLAVVLLALPAVATPPPKLASVEGES